MSAPPLVFARQSGTPAVWASEADDTEWLLTRIIAVDRHESGPLVLQPDARLDNLRLLWNEALLIGRPTSRLRRTVLLVRRAGRADMTVTRDVMVVTLPRDVRTGDLLAIPARPLPRPGMRGLHPLTGRTAANPNDILTG